MPKTNFRPPPQSDREYFQAVRLQISRELWGTFQANCKANDRQPLESLRDWIGQYNDHVKESDENPAN